MDTRVAGLVSYDEVSILMRGLVSEHGFVGIIQRMLMPEVMAIFFYCEIE